MAPFLEAVEIGGLITYPPPTNNFRWCTTGLRIKPVSKFIEKHDPNDTVVVLGLRGSESQQRDRSLKRSDNRYWQKQREGKGDYDLFLPIVALSPKAPSASRTGFPHHELTIPQLAAYSRSALLRITPVTRTSRSRSQFVEQCSPLQKIRRIEALADRGVRRCEDVVRFRGFTLGPQMTREPDGRPKHEG
jgi:hypothetical protein